MSLQFPEPVSSVFVFLFGAILGSFLNVCIYRLPLGESVVAPGSRCPGCATPIRWFRNIPILSWLLLRGRCAHCQANISIRYPLIELASAVILVLLWRSFGPTAAFAVAGWFALAMLALFFTDYDHQLLPDVITLSGTVVGLAVSWFNPFLDGVGLERVWASLSGAAIGSGLLWGFGAFYSRLRGVEAMGFGDVKMMAMVGAFTGPFGVLLTIFAGSMIGAVVGLAMIPLRGGSLQDTLPFGCFLAPAALTALLAGQRIVAAYWSAFVPIP